MEDEQAKMPAFSIFLGLGLALTQAQECFHLLEFMGKMLPGKMLHSHCSYLCEKWKDVQICGQDFIEERKTEYNTNTF